MRKFTLIPLALLMCGSSFLLVAQKRVEAGIFLDYLSISKTSTNNFGLGGRLGYRIHRNVMLEGEVAYDYGINLKKAYGNVTSGNTTALESTPIGVTEGFFGAMLEPANRRLRPFATLKGGFLDFRYGQSLLPYSTAASKVLPIPPASSLSAAIYPAVGGEASLGPVGLRLELGDTIYFDNGAHNDLRITFGPILRF